MRNKLTPELLERIMALVEVGGERLDPYQSKWLVDHVRAQEAELDEARAQRDQRHGEGVAMRGVMDDKQAELAETRRERDAYYGRLNEARAECARLEAAIGEADGLLLRAKESREMQLKYDNLYHGMRMWLSTPAAERGRKIMERLAEAAEILSVSAIRFSAFPLPDTDKFEDMRRRLSAWLKGAR